MDKYVGLFWIVYDQLYAYKVVFDSKDAVRSDSTISCGHTHSEMWDTIRKEYNLPEKSKKEHPIGEVIYDLSRYKFVVYSTSKVLYSPALQRKIVKAFKLPKFVIFKEYEEAE